MFLGRNVFWRGHAPAAEQEPLSADRPTSGAVERRMTYYTRPARLMSRSWKRGASGLEIWLGPHIRPLLHRLHRRREMRPVAWKGVKGAPEAMANLCYGMICYIGNFIPEAVPLRPLYNIGNAQAALAVGQRSGRLLWSVFRRSWPSARPYSGPIAALAPRPPNGPIAASVHNDVWRLPAMVSMPPGSRRRCFHHQCDQSGCSGELPELQIWRQRRCRARVGLGTKSRQREVEVAADGTKGSGSPGVYNMADHLS